jgi:hypothetical protein
MLKKMTEAEMFEELRHLALDDGDEETLRIACEIAAEKDARAGVSEVRRLYFHLQEGEL